MARSRGAPADLLVEESAAALMSFHHDPAGLVAACRRIVDRQLTCAPLWWLCARLLCSPEPAVEARAAVAELRDDPTARHLAAALPDDPVAVVVGWPEQSAAALVRRGDVQVLTVDVDGEAGELVRQLEGADLTAAEVPPRAVGAAVAEAAASGRGVVLLDALALGPDAALVPVGARAAAALAAHDGVPVWLVAGVGRGLPAPMWAALQRRWSDSVDPLTAGEEVLGLDLVDRVAGPAGLVAAAEAPAAVDCPVAPELFRLAG